MAKTFKYGHLFSTSATTIPGGMHSQMIPGEIGLILNSTTGSEVYKIFADDGTKVIDLTEVLAGNVKGDNLTITSVTTGDQTVLSTLLTISGVTPSSGTVREEWKLCDHNGTALGDTIKIYKDQTLYNAYLGHEDDTITSTSDPTVIPGTGETALCLIYILANGDYDLVTIPIGSFIDENEFASGVTWDGTAKKVTGVVDSTSEKVVLTYDTGGTSATTGDVLTVGAGGFKAQNIQTAIDAKVAAEIGKLDATVSAGTSAATSSASSHIYVQVDEVDGKLTGITVLEDGIADITSAVTSAKSSDSSVTVTDVTTVGATTGKTYDFTTEADIIPMTGYAPSGTTAQKIFGIEATDKVSEAFEKVEETLESDGTNTVTSGVHDGTGIVFIEGGDNEVRLSAGRF